MPVPVPSELRGQKYISLVTFRKTGVPVRTPVWFAERDNKLYIFSNPKAGKVKRIRNNPQVKLAACTMTGRVTGPEFAARARILPVEQWPAARGVMQEKYWLMRVPLLWSKQSVFIEIEMTV
jgi:PPOX class probable F420-dependent enzyme